MVSLRDLVEVQLEPFAMGHTYSAVGPELDIRDGAVVYLGMALHELATNSAKHGAWLKNEGTVNISWQVSGDQLNFAWLERGGPEVKHEATSGFGRILLERLVPEAVGGQSCLGFEPHGLRWTFTAPVAGILALKVASAPPVIAMAYTAP